MEKKDARVLKTQRTLASALFALLEKQDFKSITVNDICTEAMVSRTTFYVYFEDKYALLEHCLETLNRDVCPDGGELTLKERIHGVLSRVQQNVRLFKNLIMVKHDEELFKKMQSSFQRDFDYMIKEKGGDAPALPGPSDVVVAFYAAGVTNAIMMWIRGHMQYSVDEMTECLMGLILKAGV